ncbi:MAG: His/Gly/Thr/Pro-type tRNA ligase C-terminal domain-containing protein, partial [Yaniella sp.]|nr:His/Gly/Thr/Pro-type tRNA ligase C-terminal domain-containing protein [Yaniella sp.]
LDEHGKQVVVTMVSYGIGISRAVAALAEAHHDDKGLIWPMNVAPAHVHIVATGKDDEIFEAAEEFATKLEAAGVEVLYDDRRKAQAGVKFSDAELIGVPLHLIVGRGLAKGTLELKDRHADTREDIPLDDALDHVVALVRKYQNSQG